MHFVKADLYEMYPSLKEYSDSIKELPNLKEYLEDPQQLENKFPFHNRNALYNNV